GLGDDGLALEEQERAEEDRSGVDRQAASSCRGWGAQIVQPIMDRARCLSSLDVVRRQALLVAEEELAARDDRMGPAGLPQVVDLEPAVLLVLLGIRLDERHLVAFTEAVEHAVGVDEGSLAHAPVDPGDLAGE